MVRDEEWTQIWLKKNTKKEIMLFKIQTDAKNVDEAIGKMIDKLRKIMKGKK